MPSGTEGPGFQARMGWPRSEHPPVNLCIPGFSVPYSRWAPLNSIASLKFNIWAYVSPGKGLSKETNMLLPLAVYSNTRLHPEDAVCIKCIPITEVSNGKTITGFGSPCHKIKIIRSAGCPSGEMHVNCHLQRQSEQAQKIIAHDPKELLEPGESEIAVNQGEILDQSTLPGCGP
ncbi:hypothetical protein WISP_135908 [Willisornis vidua]|uniref:Uncharacterized protein n=1 Tax=Willisornis vidua TaxID=1566151 RepID=A0ABQ9CTS5_9PASS|nr:hypothetical protein WISP_135908 [Willisornis vidua]